MLWLFIIISAVTWVSTLLRLVMEILLRKTIFSGRATATDVVSYLGLESLDELDDWRAREPQILKVVPGPLGPYASVEFTFSPRRLKPHRRSTLSAWVRSIPLHVAALVLLVVAMGFSHESFWGWVALMLAVFIELMQWALPQAIAISRRPPPSLTTTVRISSRAEAVSRESNEAAEAVEFSSTRTVSVRPVVERGDTNAGANGSARGVDASSQDARSHVDGPILAPRQAAAPDTTGQRHYQSIVLLRAPWQPAPGAITASLRRAGQRDAEPCGPEADDGRARIAAGPIVLDCTPVDERVDAAQLECAAAQSWDFPDAAAVIENHAAHLVLTTSTDALTERTEVVRLHARAHAALTEFAPVLASFWIYAGRLVPAARLAIVVADAVTARGALAACVSFRTTPIGESSSAMTVSDTVGLHGFGMPDLQFVTDHEPDEAVSAALYELAERSLRGDLGAGATQPLKTAQGYWRTQRGPARIGPVREVLDLQPAPNTPMQV